MNHCSGKVLDRPCLVTGFPPRRPGFEPGSGHVGFMVYKVARGQVFSEYFGFPCLSSFHQLLHNHHHLSSGAGTIGQLVAAVPSGLSLTSREKNKSFIRILEAMGSSLDRDIPPGIFYSPTSRSIDHLPNFAPFDAI
jgi:hypothetical protein